MSTRAWVALLALCYIALTVWLLLSLDSGVQCSDNYPC